MSLANNGIGFGFALFGVVIFWIPILLVAIVAASFYACGSILKEIFHQPPVSPRGRR